MYRGSLDSIPARGDCEKNVSAADRMEGGIMDFAPLITWGRYCFMVCKIPIVNVLEMAFLAWPF